jgi:endoglucanase
MRHRSVFHLTLLAGVALSGPAISANGFCPADFNGDQLVNTDELLEVLAGWGQCPEQPASCPADFDQSGAVNVNDLLGVISGWGVCPTDPEDPCSGYYTDITCWGSFHGSNNNSRYEELVSGRTAITTEAMLAYNDLRGFLGLSELDQDEVGQWAFDESLTNNDQAWGGDMHGVGLYYMMQGAKVGWIRDDAYDPQLLSDIQRTARLVSNPSQMKSEVMDMVRQHCHEGYADHLEQNGLVDRFINTLQMEPHYGGWMHGRTHGFRPIEGGTAINHDLNHLTVLSWDQMQPFMNDTFDWPQWPALNVSDSTVIEYFQSMVTLGDPEGDNM